MKLILAITGATGSIYGVRLLESLSATEHSVELIISEWGKRTLELETDCSLEYVESLADKVYDNSDLAAAPASGSYRWDSMIVAPCSMKTLAAVACGLSDNLIVRCCDVALKERRSLIMMPRETPLTPIHINNMSVVSQAGAVLVPPMVAFYHRPQTVADIVDQGVGKVLDILGIDHSLFKRWGDKNE